MSAYPQFHKFVGTDKDFFRIYPFLSDFLEKYIKNGYTETKNLYIPKTYVTFVSFPLTEQEGKPPTTPRQNRQEKVLPFHESTDNASLLTKGTDSVPPLAERIDKILR